MKGNAIGEASRQRGAFPIRTCSPHRIKSTLFTLLLFALTAGAPEAVGQDPSGRIVGRVVDAETAQPLVGVLLEVPGTGARALTGIDGQFVLPPLPAGLISISSSMLGYDTETITAVRIPESGSITVQVAMRPAALVLDAITVSVVADRGTVRRALDRQRTALSVTNEVTAEEISRSPDGDAAAAMQRASGVSVQDGKFIVVRGLGERYTTTSLNGSRLPSPEPERKMVPLDLFPSGLIQSITTAKTFTPNLSGDFSGGQVDIQTREFPAQRQVTYSYSLGFNAAVTGRSLFMAPSAGGEWMAFATNPRRMPGTLANRSSFEGVDQSDFNNIVRSFRNKWSVQQQTALPSSSMSMSVGGTDPFLGRSIGYLASMTYSINYQGRIDESRAVALPGAEGATLEASRFSGSLGRTSVLWGGLVNLGTMVGTEGRIALNASYNRSADNDGRRERGIDENTAADLRIDRLQYVERSVASVQLTGEHALARGHRFDWSFSASSVRRQEPDRSEVVYLIERNGAGEEMPAAWALTGNEVAVRTFADLAEDALEARANYRLSLGSSSRPFDIIVGGAARLTDRDADNRAWSVQSIGRNPLSQNRSLREQAPEEIFGDAFTQPGDTVFSVVPIAQGGSYSAQDRLFAGYAMVEAMLTPRLQMVTGARVERSELDLQAISTIRSEYRANPTYVDVLPSLSFNLRIADNHNLRLSASQTLARPEYRELAPVQYREVIGGENTRGNADLKRTLIQNADLRWEFYPNPGEVLSMAVFAKRFQDPIERIYLASSGTPINTFVNAEGARNVGVELEVRKGLALLGPAFRNLELFANSTLMRSRITIGNDGLASTTNPDRPMLGQAPYVINTGLSYVSEHELSATLLYNRIGERIVAAAGAPLPDVYELPKSSLDFSLRFPLPGNFSGKIDLENLLDTRHQLQQGDVIREYYRTGRAFSVGVTHRR